MDPRVARTRAAVLRAATDLLVDAGPWAVTIDAIVQRSGVARSTIYRHWTSRDEVLLAVLEDCAPAIEAPDPSLGFEDDLRALVGQLGTAMRDPEWARVAPSILGLKHHLADIAELDERIGERQEHAIEAVLRRGIAAGHLPDDLDLDEASAFLVGPLTFAFLTGHPAIDAGLCVRAVDVFLASYAAVATHPG
jgi:AcrR family transcriptional regulator